MGCPWDQLLWYTYIRSVPGSKRAVFTWTEAVSFSAVSLTERLTSEWSANLERELDTKLCFKMVLALAAVLVI